MGRWVGRWVGGVPRTHELVCQGELDAALVGVAALHVAIARVLRAGRREVLLNDYGVWVRVRVRVRVW